MNTPVKVVADENGMIIRQSKNNPDYGYVVLNQARTSIQSNPTNIKNVGWVKTQNVSTLIKGTMEELKLFGFKKDTVLPGKIVIKESTTPFSEENPDQHLKIAGSTGIVCCVDGEPIYRVTYYTTDLNEQDEYVQHDNVDAIRQANSSSLEQSVNNTELEEMEEEEDSDIINEVETFEL